MQLNRTGRVVINDASLDVWEEPKGRVEDEWQRAFKRDVFLRIVQQLNRLGWTCEVPSDMAERYSLSFARKHRICRKGDLRASLDVSGRHIELRFWQDVANVSNPNGGRYDSDRERRMPYVLWLEMERTRRRVATYLCNVFAGYDLKPRDPECGVTGLTALEWIERRVRGCWHYKPELGRRGGEEAPYNCRSADGAQVRHGAKVWTTDWKGRVITGTALYNINNMWWVVTGRYGWTNVGCFEIYTTNPGNLRVKRNGRRRSKRLEEELASAVQAMNFERAARLRDLLFPNGVPHPEARAA